MLLKQVCYCVANQCHLTLMMLVANFAKYKMMQKTWKITETLAYGYSSESAQWELSNEYQHDRV